MKRRKEIYQHFSKEDYEFIDRSLEMIRKVEDTYSYLVTSFLNPHQVAILEVLGKTAQLQVFSSELVLQTEFVKIILAPSYYELDMADFGLSLLEIEYPNKFHQLTHRQIMGTLLHQLGIERKLFGDIFVCEGRAQVVVEEKFATFFIDHVHKIAQASVRLKSIEFSEALPLSKEEKTKDLLVSSMRLDKIISAAFHLSRTTSAKLIQSKQVKVNYTSIEEVSRLVSTDDLISVRGYGRILVIGEDGLSKNGKHKLRVALVSSK